MAPEDDQVVAALHDELAAAAAQSAPLTWDRAPKLCFVDDEGRQPCLAYGRRETALVVDPSDFNHRSFRRGRAGAWRRCCLMAVLRPCSAGSGMVLLLGALNTLGIQPGPQLLLYHLDLVWTLVWALVLANMIAVVMFPLSRDGSDCSPLFAVGSSSR